MKNLKLPYLFIALLAVAAYFSVGYHHVDEHFQVLELARYKLGQLQVNELTWEFPERMRSGLLPFLAFVFTKSASMVGAQDPFAITFAMRLFAGLLAFAGIRLLLNTLSQTWKNEESARFFRNTSYFLWFVPFLSVRFSSEGLAGSCFLIAFAMLLEQDKGERFFRNLGIGAALGFSFLFRYQMGFMLAGLGLWMIIVQKTNLRRLSATLAGGLSVLVLGVLIDHWLYGEWTLSALNYLKMNIVENKAAHFGESPIYFYLQQMVLMGVPPLSLFLLGSLLFVLVKFPKHPLTWAIVPFLLAHHFIGHKEFRFLFPLAPLIPLCLALFYQEYNERNGLFWKILRNGFQPLAYGLNALALVVFALKPADTTTPTYRYLYQNHHGPCEIYYTQANPFAMKAALETNKEVWFGYYLNPQAKFIHIDSLSQIPTQSNGTQLLVVNTEFSYENKEIEHNPRFQKRYRNFLSIFDLINFGNWLRRDDCWEVYELT